MKNVSLFALIVLLFSLNACQKDAISPIADVETTTNSTLSATDLTNLKTSEFVKVPAIPETNDSKTLLTRSTDKSDIQDVYPNTSSDFQVYCTVFNDDCIATQLSLRNFNSIKEGTRIGKLSTVNLEGSNLRNAKNTYISHTNVGVIAMGGYNGKENRHPFKIEEDGNYRIQLTPLSATRNLDVFVYKLTPRNGEIDSTLVAYGTLPAGKTETVHIGKKGYYTIIVDEKDAYGTDTNYMLSVSQHTSVKTTPILQYGELSYKFDNIYPFGSYSHTGWNIKGRTSGSWINLGNFTAGSILTFTSCNSCDYLVTPLFSYSGNVLEGTPTMVHP
jgi:hypothetical protein